MYIDIFFEKCLLLSIDDGFSANLIHTSQLAGLNNIIAKTNNNKTTIVISYNMI